MAGLRETPVNELHVTPRFSQELSDVLNLAVVTTTTVLGSGQR